MIDQIIGPTSPAVLEMAETEIDNTWRRIFLWRLCTKKSTLERSMPLLR